MSILKRVFIFSVCFFFFLISVRLGHAQPKTKKPKPVNTEVSLMQENIALNKRLKKLEETISQQDKTQLELKDKLNKLQKERDSLAQTPKDKGGLRIKTELLNKQIASLKKDKAILEAILKLQTRDLRQPVLVKPAEKNLDKAIHLYLGYAYGMKAKINEAIGEYRKAIQCDPEDKDIHYNLGYLLSKQHRYKEAIEEYKKSLKGSPQDREVYYNLAIIYAIYLKDQKTAREYYQRFLELSPKDTGLTSQTEKQTSKN